MKERNIFAAVTVEKCLIDGQPKTKGDVVIVCADTFRNLGDNGKKRLRAATTEETAKAKTALETSAETEVEEAAEKKAPAPKAKTKQA